MIIFYNFPLENKYCEFSTSTLNKTVCFVTQDEEQDPLLHGFSQLKDQLVTVSGEYAGLSILIYFETCSLSCYFKTQIRLDCERVKMSFRGVRKESILGQLVYCSSRWPCRIIKCSWLLVNTTNYIVIPAGFSAELCFRAWNCDRYRRICD